VAWHRWIQMTVRMTISVTRVIHSCSHHETVRQGSNSKSLDRCIRETTARRKSKQVVPYKKDVCHMLASSSRFRSFARPSSMLHQAMSSSGSKPRTGKLICKCICIIKGQEVQPLGKLVEVCSSRPKAMSREELPSNSHVSSRTWRAAFRPQ
jgi:hypothetical protein